MYSTLSVYFKIKIIRDKVTKSLEMLSLYFPRCLPPLSQFSYAIFTMAAIPVLEAGSVPAGDLPRVGAPLVDVVVEPVVGALRTGEVGSLQET